MKTMIVLDIDGTITNCHYTTPSSVIEYFTSLQARGFVFAFVTGRTFSRGLRSLAQMNFPFYFSVNNGAMLWQMPEKKVLKQKFVEDEIIGVMDEICHAEGGDFVIYSTIEDKDITYYRNGYFSQKDLDFLLTRSAALNEVWSPISGFDSFSSPILCLKYFGARDAAVRIAESIEKLLNLHVPVIADPFDKEYCIVQATHPNASKGCVLRDLRELDSSIDFVIAAGDDSNDLSMLLEADVKIAMNTAPKTLLDVADIIAPSAEYEGIIEGLKRAISIIGK